RGPSPTPRRRDRRARPRDRLPRLLARARLSAGTGTVSSRRRAKPPHHRASRLGTTPRLSRADLLDQPGQPVGLRDPRRARFQVRREPVLVAMGAELHQPAGGGAVSDRAEWRKGALGVTGRFVRGRKALAATRRGELLALSPERSPCAPPSPRRAAVSPALRPPVRVRSRAAPGQPAVDVDARRGPLCSPTRVLEELQARDHLGPPPGDRRAVRVHDLQRRPGHPDQHSAGRRPAYRSRPGQTRGRGVTRVAVVGGGPAGLAAAYRLTAAGVPTVVFEAGSSIGGLARSMEIWGQPVDLGAHMFTLRDPRIGLLWTELVGTDYDAVPRM